MTKPADVKSHYAGVEGMRAFVQCWQNTTTEKLKRKGQAGIEALRFLQNSPLRNQGAAVADLELRLGTRLPKSYADFVAVGGTGVQFFEMLDMNEFEYGFIAPQEVNLFHNRHPMDAEIWTGTGIKDASDSEYYKYAVNGYQQGMGRIRPSYVPKLVVVGEMPGGEFFLLNPIERTQDGEWEAWMLSPRIPGAYRFYSFAEMLSYFYLHDTAKEGDNVLTRYSMDALKGTCGEPLFRR